MSKLSDTRKLQWAKMFMEYYFAFENIVADFKRIHGEDELCKMFPYLADVQTNYIELIFGLLKDVDPILARMWDEAAYPNAKLEDEQ